MLNFFNKKQLALCSTKILFYILILYKNLYTTLEIEFFSLFLFVFGRAIPK